MDFPGYKVIRDIIDHNWDRPREIENPTAHRLVKYRGIIDDNFICHIEITPSTNPTNALAFLSSDYPGFKEIRDSIDQI
ncbi:hypothetical protein DPMN_096001 [Dreissena polymorpha]|nr:hypothetical protein DPMN_096001 [Dreissena polymorpha]